MKTFPPLQANEKKILQYGSYLTLTDADTWCKASIHAQVLKFGVLRHIFNGYSYNFHRTNASVRNGLHTGLQALTTPIHTTIAKDRSS
jgi:hypothetical protein